jgi:hypothetical protein
MRFHWRTLALIMHQPQRISGQLTENRTFRPLAQAGNERLSGRVLVRLVSRELIEVQLRHDVRILGAETRIVFPRPPCGTSGIDQTTLGDHPPVLHFFGDQEHGEK